MGITNGTTELKPCPNCGAKNGQTVGNTRVGNRFVGATDYFVRCDDCGFMIRGYQSEAAAVRAWNETINPSCIVAGKMPVSEPKWHDLKKNPKDMPAEHDSIFAHLKGTAKWNPHMFEKVSDHVDVTVELMDGTRVVDTAKTKDGKWSPDRTYFSMGEVIAWRERPAPYRGEEAEESRTEEDGGNWLMDQFMKVT